MTFFSDLVGVMGGKLLGQIEIGMRIYGFRMPSFRIRARKVLELSPRISEAPFFPATFQRVSSSIRIMWSRSTVSSVFGVVAKSF
jgi:hypothetical protein